MNEELNTMLNDEMIHALEKMSTLNPDSEEYQTAVEGFVKLHKQAVDYFKAVSDDNKAFDESQYRKEQLAEQKKDRHTNIALKSAEIGVPLVFYTIFMVMGFHFEQEGTIASLTFRNFFNHIRPTKK